MNAPAREGNKAPRRKMLRMVVTGKTRGLEAGCGGVSRYKYGRIRELKENMGRLRLLII